MLRRLRTLPVLALFASRNISRNIPNLPKAISQPFPLYKFSNAQPEPFDYLEEQAQMIDGLKKKTCEGCGAHFQCEKEDVQGYIPRDRALKIMYHNKEIEENPLGDLTGDQVTLKAQRLLKERSRTLDKMAKNDKHPLVQLQFDDYETLDTLEKSNMLKKGDLSKVKDQKIKRLICMRCHGLKKKSQIDDAENARVTSVEPKRILDGIFHRVKKGSTILHVVDLSDFSATISKKVFDYAKKKECKVLLAINKLDVMPAKLDEGKIKFWIRSRVAEYGMRLMPENIFLLSSRTGNGMKRLGGVLKKQAENMRKSEKDLYIIGHTNAGKTSLINKLIKESNKYEKDIYRDPFKEQEQKSKKEVQQRVAVPDEGSLFGKILLKKEEFPEEEVNEVQEILAEGEEAEAVEENNREAAEAEENNSEAAEVEEEVEQPVEEEKLQIDEEDIFQIHEAPSRRSRRSETEQQEEKTGDEDSEFKLKPEVEDLELTVSPFHGTTLELVKVEDLHLGWRIWDTPGIPNLQHVSTFMEDQKEATKLLHQKQVNPQKFLIRQNESLWVGALARLDFTAGDEVCAVVYASNQVSLHKTSKERSNMLYLKRLDDLLTPSFRADPTKTVFKSYEIEIETNFDGFGTTEVDIYGVGWVGFYSYGKGNTKTTFTLYLPQEVGFDTRAALIRFDSKKMPIYSRHNKTGPVSKDPSRAKRKP